MSKVTRLLVSTKQHPVSKLRLYKFESLKTSASLSERERSLLEKREALQAWNHDYWCKNNSDFQKKKKEFIQSQLKNQASKEDLYETNESHEELAAFYKDFLDSNRHKHIAYNFEWYKGNISLLWPSFIVKLEGLFRRR